MTVFAKLREEYKGKTIYVLGHDVPDTDTVLSTELFCRFARRAGIDVCPVRTGEIGEKERRVFSEHGIDFDGWTDETAPDSLLFLVDCHTTARPGTPVGCIDHHPTAEPMPEPLSRMYINGRFSSAAAEVMRQAKREGIDVQPDDEIVALISIYMDTQSMISPKFDKNDLPMMDEITDKYGIDREKLTRLGLCFTDLDAPAEVVAFGGTKYHEFGTHRVASSHIEAEKVPEKLAVSCAEICNRRRREEGLELWLLFVAEPLMPRSVIYELTDEGCVRTEYDRMLSRSVDIIPALEKKYSAE